MDALGKDLLSTLLASLAVESCLPIFLSHDMDVFRWLGMKHPDDFMGMGIESMETCQILALFTRALQRHLNGLPPLLVEWDDDDDIDEDGNGIQERIHRTVALFDRHTRTPFSSAYSAAVFPNQSPKPTVSQLPDHRIASTSSPPSYEPSKPNRKNSISKGLIRRLSLQKKPHRPSTPVYDHLASSGLLLSTQQQHQRDQTQRKRWEKRRSCVILPREEEGQEELPAYHCTVHKQGHVYVKREMEGPTQKTRWNRSWKPLYVELWGTLLFFYPLTTLHTTQEGDSIPLASLLAYRQTPPLETINLAHANATRAWDYVKRPHALRLVTDQGPHLLLRLDTHLEMVSWIEHLQAAINISLDLELRPMPKFMTLPTRVSVSNIYADPRALQFEHMREQRLLEQNEMLI